MNMTGKGYRVDEYLLHVNVIIHRSERIHTERSSLMIIEISALIAAIAFVVLVIYLIKTLVSAKTSLDQATQTLADIQQTIDAVSTDVKEVVSTANEMTSNIHVQVKKLEPVVDSVENVGEALEEITSVLKSVSVGFTKGIRKAAKRFDEAPKKEAPAKPAAPVSNTVPFPVPAATQEVVPADGSPEWEAGMAEAAAAYEAPAAPVAPAKKTVNPEQWKAWVDLGVQAWQLFRKS